MTRSVKFVNCSKQQIRIYRNQHTEYNNRSRSASVASGLQTIAASPHAHHHSKQHVICLYAVSTDGTDA